MGIWEPTTCCCCCGVRTGSIVLAILFLIGGIFNILGGVKTLIIGDPNLEEACKDTSDPHQCEEEFWKIELGVTITSLLVSIFHIIFSSLLLHGILKKKTAYFIPLMTVYAIQIGFMILVGATVMIILIVFQVLFGIIVVFAAFFGLLVFMQTYFLLVIRAHYYEIKREKGHIHTALNDRHEEVPPYPGPQVPPYSAPQNPPYPMSQNAPYPMSQNAPYPVSQVPPYPGNEVPPYPGSDVPLYPGQEKAPM